MQIKVFKKVLHAPPFLPDLSPDVGVDIHELVPVVEVEPLGHGDQVGLHLLGEVLDRSVVVVVGNVDL